jgi:hypothetical protein
MKRLLYIFLLFAYSVSVAQNTDSQLTTQANVIRNETQPAANTPLRVGNMFRALIDNKKNDDDCYKSSGSSNTYAITIQTGVVNFNNDFGFMWKVNAGNTGAITLNPNGLGAKSVRKNYNATLVSGDLTAGQIYPVVYDAEAGWFQIMLPGSGGGGGSTTVTDGNGTTGNGSAADFGGTLNQNTSLAGAGIYSLSLGTSVSRLSTFTTEASSDIALRTTGGNFNIRAGQYSGIFSDFKSILIYNGSTTPNYTGAHPNVGLWLKGSFTNFGSGTEFTGLTWLPNSSTAFVNSISTTPPSGGFYYDIDEGRPGWYDGTQWRYIASMDDVSGGGSDFYDVQEISAGSQGITDADNGKVFVYTNALGCVVTMDETVTPGVSFTAIRATGAGEIEFQAGGSAALYTVGNELKIEVEEGWASWVYQSPDQWRGTGTLGPASSGGGTVETVVAGNLIDVDATDPANPIVAVETGDKGDVTIGSNSLTIDNLAVTNAKINDVALSKITGFGTGIATALAINIGSSGAPVLFNGAGGTPSSMTGTNITGVPISTGLTGGAANKIPYFTSSTALSTSGAPIFDGTNLGVGATPQSVLTVSGQSTIQAPVSSSTAQFVGIDGAPLRLTFDTHNNASGSGTAFMVRRSRGTAGTPAALSSGDVIAAFSGRGYGTSQYAAASTGLINIKANQAFTNTANGTYISFDATPDNSVTAAEVVRFGGSGQIGFGGANFGTSGNTILSGGSGAAVSWGQYAQSNLSGLGTGVSTFLGTPSWTNFNSMITGTAPFWNTSGSTTVTTPTITGKVTWTQASESSTNTFQTFTQAAHTGGSPTAFLVNGGAHTTLAAATEAPDVNLNLNRSVQFTGGGTFPLQRAVIISAPTYNATTSTTITNLATLSVAQPPTGTNVTPTNKSAILVVDPTNIVQVALNEFNTNFGQVVFGNGGSGKAARGSIGSSSITAGSFSDSGTALRFHAAAGGATVGAFQFTTLSSNLLNTGASILINASPNYAESSSIGAAHSVFRTGFTFTHAGTTGNRITGFLADPTLNTTSTNASTVEGFTYAPTVTALNGNSVNKAFRHTSGYVQWESVLSPSQITSNQNNYDPAGLNNGGAPNGASIVRLSSDASRDLTSIVGGAQGRLLVLVNVGSQNIVLKDDDGATGTAANRLQLNADITLLPEQSIMLWYDGTSSRWRSMR